MSSERAEELLSCAIGTRITPSEKEDLKYICNLTGMNTAKICRLALVYFLNQIRSEALSIADISERREDGKA